MPETVSLDIVAAAGASVNVVAEVHRVEEEEEEEMTVVSKGRSNSLLRFLSVTKRYMCGCSWCCFLCSNVGCQLLH